MKSCKILLNGVRQYKILIQVTFHTQKLIYGNRAQVL